MIALSCAAGHPRRILGMLNPPSRGPLTPEERAEIERAARATITSTTTITATGLDWDAEEVERQVQAAVQLQENQSTIGYQIRSGRATARGKWRKTNRPSLVAVGDAPARMFLARCQCGQGRSIPEVELLAHIGALPPGKTDLDIADLLGSP